MPVVNLSNNWNRGDEVRLAVVKKQISSQVRSVLTDIQIYSLICM